jgi:hypothetical protein
MITRITKILIIIPKVRAKEERGSGWPQLCSADVCAIASATVDGLMHAHLHDKDFTSLPSHLHVPKVDCKISGRATLCFGTQLMKGINACLRFCASSLWLSCHPFTLPSEPDLHCNSKERLALETRTRCRISNLMSILVDWHRHEHVSSIGVSVD